MVENFHLSDEARQIIHNSPPESIARNLWTFGTGVEPILSYLLQYDPRKGAEFARSLVHSKPSYINFLEEAMGKQEAQQLLNDPLDTFSTNNT